MKKEGDVMKVSVAIDDRQEHVEIKDELLLGVLEQNEVSVDVRGTEAVAKALQNPIGTGKLKTLVKPGEKVAIVTSDITRPLPSRFVLPPKIGRAHV